MEKAYNKRRRFITSVVLAALAVATVSASVYVASRGGIAEVLQLPPVLDRSTPVEQQGYRVAEIVRPPDKMDFAYNSSTHTIPSTTDAMNEPGVAQTDIGKDKAVAGVWITTPLMTVKPQRWVISAAEFRPLPFLLPATKNRRAASRVRAITNIPPTPPFYVTERASTGQAFPADWQFFTNTTPQLLFVPIPGGYSNRMRWIDIIVTDQFHRVMKWRIVRLPAARQALPTSPSFAERASFRGATITARAIRNFGGGIRVERLPQVPVSGGRQWEIDLDAPVTNWEPVTGNLSQWETTQAVVTDPEVARSFNMRGFTRCADIQTPFASDDTAVQQSGTLTQFDTLTETVHFPHLRVVDLGLDPNFGEIFGLRIPSATSETTPSGIKVTLCKQDPKPGMLDQEGEFSYEEPLNLIFTVSPDPWNRHQECPEYDSSRTIWLKASPLVQRYNRPASLKLDFGIEGLPGEARPAPQMGNTPYMVGFTDVPHEKITGHLKKARYVDLDVKVIQRVNLYSMPFTLTLPLHDPVASDRPWASPWNPLIR